ncbi:hypothetical protein BDR07DRAFT_1386116 [Suillus spraguei]|nr:hypothetical protein BDR07DRAFT_1386116 [Suillus spraguei]
MSTFISLSNASTGALKNEMKERESKFTSVDQSRIQLYRISESEDKLRERIDTLNSCHSLEGTRSIPLLEYFLGVPVLKQFYDIFQVHSDNNTCGRPRELEEAIPATLLPPIFGQFINDSRTHTITEEENNMVDELANSMSALYENKNQQVDAVGDVLKRYRLGFHMNGRVQGTAYVTDADMSFRTIHAGSLVLLGVNESIRTENVWVFSTIFLLIIFDPNILVKKDDYRKFMIIDFDWAGVEGLCGILHM